MTEKPGYYSHISKAFDIRENACQKACFIIPGQRVTELLFNSFQLQY